MDPEPFAKNLSSHWMRTLASIFKNRTSFSQELGDENFGGRNGIKRLIKHKELSFHLLRNYSFDIYKQALERALFPNYDNFHNPDIAYNNFINRLGCVVNFIAPFKTVRVKKQHK